MRLSDMLLPFFSVIRRTAVDHAAADILSEREREIITLRFGLGGREEKTQKEVADYIGISQSYISRLEKRILSQLKKEFEKAM